MSNPLPPSQPAEPPPVDLTKVEDYLRYLYEAEERRSERFHAATQTYLLFIGSTFAGTLGALEWLDLKPSRMVMLGAAGVAVAILLIAALIVLVVSFVLTVLVIKVWPKERLCLAPEFVLRTGTFNRESFQAAVIANFAIATDRDSRSNDRKGAVLGAASVTYRIALLLLMVAGLLYLVR
jgi:hypothetical protein